MATDQLSQSLVAPVIVWRGIGIYLAICFGITWGVKIAALALGLRFAHLTIGTTLMLAAVMLVPAISAFVVRRWITREGFATAGLQIGSSKGYLCVWLGVPCVFAIIYGLTCAFKWEVFSTDLTALFGSLPPLPPGKRLPPAPVLIAGVGFRSLTAGVVVTSLFTFGEEFGWTGYLLPKLLPLGSWRAVGIYGVIWGLWHAPIVAGGFNYPGHPVAGILLMCAFTCGSWIDAMCVVAALPQRFPHVVSLRIDQHAGQRGVRDGGHWR